MYHVIPIISSLSSLATDSLSSTLSALDSLLLLLLLWLVVDGVAPSRWFAFDNDILADYWPALLCEQNNLTQLPKLARSKHFCLPRYLLAITKVWCRSICVYGEQKKFSLCCSLGSIGVCAGVCVVRDAMLSDVDFVISNAFQLNYSHS